MSTDESMPSITLSKNQSNLTFCCEVTSICNNDKRVNKKVAPNCGESEGEGGWIAFENGFFMKYMNPDYDRVDSYLAEGEAGQILFLWDKFLEEKYEFSLRPIKFILFISVQDPTNYYWVKRRPYDISRPTVRLSTHRSAKSVPFILAQGPTNYYWPIEGPYEISRATGT